MIRREVTRTSSICVGEQVMAVRFSSDGPVAVGLYKVPILRVRSYRCLRCSHLKNTSHRCRMWNTVSYELMGWKVEHVVYPAADLLVCLIHRGKTELHL